MAQEFDALANAVKMAESKGQRFDPKNPNKLLTSSAGAEGEMQVLPKTQRDPGYGVTPAKDRSPSEIARVGKDYLQAMLNKYGNEQHALVAYNWGPKNADNWLASGAKQEHLPPETQKYIQKVQEYKGKPLSTGTRVQKMTEADLKEAGPSYKAALAMSFLVDDADAKGKKPEEDIWKEDEATAAAEPAYQNPLADMELSYQSPFATQTASAKQQLAQFAQGGVVNRADGSPETGEVKEPWLPQVSTYAELTAQDMYPGQQGQYDQRDAARHMLAAGTLARKYGPGTAELLGKAHEITTSPLRYIGSKLGISQMPVDYEQDLHNNKVGIELAARSKSQKDLEDLVMQMAEQHSLQQTAGKPWTGKPVRRNDGSPETGEIGPAFGNPNIQRQGAKARALAAQRDVNTLPDPKTYAATSGFLGTPFEEQGWSVLHPQRKAIQNAADVGFVAGTAAQIAPVVGPAAKALAKMTGSAINESMLAGKSLTPGINTPSPINFAVRPEPGGFFLHNQRLNLDDVDQFLRHYVGVQKESTNPLDQWMYKRYSNYMRGTMGTETDPLVRAADQGKRLHFLDQEGLPFQPDYVDHVPYMRQQMGLPRQGFAQTSTGREVERSIDATINPIPVEDVGDMNLSPRMRELQTRNPSQPVYEIMHEEARDLLKPEDMKTALSDMLRDTTLPDKYRLTQDQLNKMTLVEASEKVAQFNQYMEGRKSAQLLQAAKEIPVYKTYKEDNGYRWMAPEDVGEDHASMQYVVTAGKDANWCTKNPSTCESYASGEDRLLILTDQRGKPLAQVQYQNRVPEARDWLDTLDTATATELGENYMLHQIERLPEYQRWAHDNTEKVITEIKGRHNETNLSGPVLDKVRDLIRTGDWSMVKDLKNAQLVDTDQLLSRSPDFVPGQGFTPRYEKAIKDRFGTLYLTPEEVPEAQAIIKTIAMPPENRAKGGLMERVSNDNRRYL